MHMHMRIALKLFTRMKPSAPMLTRSLSASAVHSARHLDKSLSEQWAENKHASPKKESLDQVKTERNVAEWFHEMNKMEEKLSDRYPDLNKSKSEEEMADFLHDVQGKTLSELLPPPENVSEHELDESGNIPIGNSKKSSFFVEQSQYPVFREKMLKWEQELREEKGEEAASILVKNVRYLAVGRDTMYLAELPKEKKLTSEKVHGCDLQNPRQPYTFITDAVNRRHQLNMKRIAEEILKNEKPAGKGGGRGD